MQARGHIVVLLSADTHRRDAERRYLEQYCAAKAFDGMIEIVEHYKDLTRFEKVFLGELELNITKSYEVRALKLIPGKLTEDIPVFVREHAGSQGLDVFVDVRHPEIAKLQDLGFTQILYSLIRPSAMSIWRVPQAMEPAVLRRRRSQSRSPFEAPVRAVGLTQGRHRRRSQRWTAPGGHPIRRSRHECRRRSGELHAAGARQALPRILQVVDVGRRRESAVLHSTSGFCFQRLRRPFARVREPWRRLGREQDRVRDLGHRERCVQVRDPCDEVVATVIDGAPRAEGAIQLDRPLQNCSGGCTSRFRKRLSGSSCRVAMSRFAWSCTATGLTSVPQGTGHRRIWSVCDACPSAVRTSSSHRSGDARSLAAVGDGQNRFG